MNQSIIYIILLIIIILIIINNYIIKDDIILGKTKEGIECYLNKGDNKGKINSVLNNKYYTGIKWECVEFIRRYLILIKRVTFKNVDSALDLLKLSNMIHIDSLLSKNIYHFKNGENKIKEGDLIICINENDIINGHIVMVSNNNGDEIEIIEQNYDNRSWEDRNYSRKWYIKKNKIYSNDKNEKIIDIIRIE